MAAPSANDGSTQCLRDDAPSSHCQDNDWLMPATTMARRTIVCCMEGSGSSVRPLQPPIVIRFEYDRQDVPQSPAEQGPAANPGRAPWPAPRQSTAGSHYLRTHSFGKPLPNKQTLQEISCSAIPGYQSGVLPLDTRVSYGAPDWTVVIDTWAMPP